MYLKNLRLHNFRNYSSFEITFSPHLNSICGGNAIGKTNLIEAIYLLSSGRSFRDANFSDLIKKGEKYFFIEAEIIKDDISQNIKIYYDGNEKKIEYNSTKYKTFSNLIGIMPAIMYAPDDSYLISGKPIFRRKFLNLHLAQIDPLYVHHLIRYLKAMKHRNALLKQKNITSIKSFESQLAISGSYISHKRNALISLIKTPIIKIIKKLTDIHKDIDIIYSPSITLKNDTNETYLSYLKELEKSRPKEVLLGSTIIGPHRDDFNIYINNLLAKDFASEGQKKLIISAIRLAQWDILSSKINEDAIMCIDDYGVHLDMKHKNLLKSNLKTFSQVFITSPLNEDFENANIIELKK